MTSHTVCVCLALEVSGNDTFLQRHSSLFLDNQPQKASVCQLLIAIQWICFLKPFSHPPVKNKQLSPAQVAQLVRASSPYAKVTGSIPGQGTYKKQPMNT